MFDNLGLNASIVARNGWPLAVVLDALGLDVPRDLDRGDWLIAIATGVAVEVRLSVWDCAGIGGGGDGEKGQGRPDGGDDRFRHSHSLVLLRGPATGQKSTRPKGLFSCPDFAGTGRGRNVPPPHCRGPAAW